MSNGLIHVIYTSSAVKEPTEGGLASLLRKARQKNASLELSGMLLYSAGTFFQVLEGPPANVERLFDTIKTDPRHTGVTRIIAEPIRRRAFASWTMGFAQAALSELASIDGLNDFFRGGSCIGGLDQGRAKKLLAAFAGGRWRGRVAGAAGRAA